MESIPRCSGLHVGVSGRCCVVCARARQHGENAAMTAASEVTVTLGRPVALRHRGTVTPVIHLRLTQLGQFSRMLW